MIAIEDVEVELIGNVEDVGVGVRCTHARREERDGVGEKDSLCGDEEDDEGKLGVRGVEGPLAGDAVVADAEHRDETTTQPLDVIIVFPTLRTPACTPYCLRRSSKRARGCMRSNKSLKDSSRSRWSSVSSAQTSSRTLSEMNRSRTWVSRWRDVKGDGSELLLLR